LDHKFLDSNRGLFVGWWARKVKFDNNNNIEMENWGENKKETLFYY